MVTPLTLAQARAYAKQVVDAQGRDFVYNPSGVTQCYYEARNIGMPDDPRRQTGCLVGRILDLHGETGHRDAMAPIYELDYQLPSLRDSPEVGKVREYLSELQRQQDQGETWGYAFDAAEEFVREVA